METYNSTCIFCQIYSGSHKTEILYKDDDVVIFPDIKPAAKHHYLIVTKKHIRDAKHLTAEDLPLVELMFVHAKRILEEKGADLGDARYGFHWPPFHSVSHLHLHAISPASKMSLLPRWIFPQQSFWFVPPEYVLQRLAKL